MSINEKPTATARILVEAPLVTITGAITFDVPDTATFIEGLPEVERHGQQDVYKSGAVRAYLEEQMAKDPALFDRLARSDRATAKK